MIQTIDGRQINHLVIPKDATNGDVVNLIWNCTVYDVSNLLPGIIQVKFDDYPDIDLATWSSVWWDSRFRHPFDIVVPLDIFVYEGMTNRSMFEAVFGSIEILKDFAWWELPYLQSCI